MLAPFGVARAHGADIFREPAVISSACAGSAAHAAITTATNVVVRIMAASLGGLGKSVHSRRLPAPSNSCEDRARSAIMARHESSSSDNEPRVVSFRRGGTRTTPPPVNDLAKYQQGADTDDYRHRMIVNMAAFLFVIALIGAGLWLVDAMERMR